MAALRKRRKKSAVPAAFATKAPKFVQGVHPALPCLPEHPAEARLQPSNGDGSHTVPEPVLSPAVVAKQPTLALEMSASE